MNLSHSISASTPDSDDPDVSFGQSLLVNLFWSISFDSSSAWLTWRRRQLWSVTWPFRHLCGSRLNHQATPSQDEVGLGLGTRSKRAAAAAAAASSRRERPPSGAPAPFQRPSPPPAPNRPLNPSPARPARRCSVNPPPPSLAPGRRVRLDSARRQHFRRDRRARARACRHLLRKSRLGCRRCRRLTRSRARQRTRAGRTRLRCASGTSSGSSNTCRVRKRPR